MSSTRPLKDTIYVDIDDDITSIIDKVEAAKHKIVALVLPKRSASLQSTVNMRLLARSAESAGKNIVLITSEPALLPLAGAARLHVAKNLQSKPVIPPAPNPYLEEGPAAEAAAEELEDAGAKIDYNKPIGELAGVGTEPDEAIPLDEPSEEPAKKSEKTPPKPAKNKKLKIPNFERFRLMLALGGLGLIALITFLVFAIFILPKATITIRTASTPVSANFTLTTSDKIDVLDDENGTIPASLKATDQTAAEQVRATGQENLGTKASGEVTMTAGTCGPTFPDDVPAGTGISTNNLTFITQESTSFTAGPDGEGNCVFVSEEPTNVVAQRGGANYNIDPSTFTVSGSPGVSASSSNPMSGGTDNIVTVLSQQDIDGAKKKISSEDSDEFTQEFLDQLEQGGFYVLDSTLKLSDPVATSTPKAGERTATAEVTVKITYTVLVVPKADLEAAVKNRLTEQIDLTRQKLSTEDVLKDVSISVQGQASPTAATLSISQETTAVPIIDVNAIKNQVGGKKTSEIKALIEDLPGIESVDVDFSPFWVSKAPDKPDKITVKLEEVKTNDTDGS